jgi:hypothetical protein
LRYLLRLSEDNADALVNPPNVWVFHGEGARFASGVFEDRETALHWIARHQLTGIPTRYRVGAGCYDIALDQGRFHPTKPHHGTPTHVAGFSPAGPHVHVRNGHPD